MWKYYLCIFNIFVALVLSLRSYENYKVFRATLLTQEQFQQLNELVHQNDHYEFWTEPSSMHQTVHLMVAPEKLEEFALIMNSSRIDYETSIANIQSVIDEENSPRSRFWKPKKFTWARYHTLEEINVWLERLAKNYKEVSVVIAGRSYEGREIKGVKLSFGDREKPGVFIEGGIHASEWIGPATATYLLNEFLTSKNEEVRKLATSYDWYILPVVNPDGYVYSFTEDRLWRKSRVSHGNGCFGVDLNRNWDYKWMGPGASNNTCSGNYAGTEPFSEFEARTIAEYMKSISDKLFAFISFHSYGQYLLLPYGYTTERLDNYAEMFSIGKKAIDSLQKVYGTTYAIGNPPEIFKFASGTTMDWVKGKLNLPIVFTYELRGKEQYGVVLPAKQIIPNSKEVLRSFLTLFQEASKMGYPNVTSSINNT